MKYCKKIRRNWCHFCDLGATANERLQPRSWLVNLSTQPKSGKNLRRGSSCWIQLEVRKSDPQKQSENDDDGRILRPSNFAEKEKHFLNGDKILQK